MADTAEGLLRALAAQWDEHRAALSSLTEQAEHDDVMALGDRLGRESGALQKRVYVYLESLGPSAEERDADARLCGEGAAATEADLVRAGHTLQAIAARMGDHHATQSVLDVADWLSGRLGAPGSGHPVRLPMTEEEDAAAHLQTMAFENGCLRDEVEHLRGLVDEQAAPAWVAEGNPYTSMSYRRADDGRWYALTWTGGPPLEPIEVAALELEPRAPGHSGWEAADAIVNAEQLRHLIDGIGDAEVSIPPAGDCMDSRPDQPCPHCQSVRYHHRTRRCGDCGRRPTAPAVPGA